MSRTYGENWRLAREASGLGSPRDVASHLAAIFPGEDKKHLSANYIYQIERDEANYSLAVGKMLADVYGTTLGRIYAIDEEDTAPALPNEWAPLFEQLRTLTLADRESIIRNLASSLALQRRIFGRDGIIRTSVSIAAKHKEEEAAPSTAVGVDLGEEEAAETPHARRHPNTASQAKRKPR